VLIKFRYTISWYIEIIKRTEGNICVAVNRYTNELRPLIGSLEKLYAARVPAGITRMVVTEATMKLFLRYVKNARSWINLMKLPRVGFKGIQWTGIANSS
jgi:hypothetical protein